MPAGWGGKPRTRAHTISPSVNLIVAGGLEDEGGGGNDDVDVSLRFLSDLLVVVVAGFADASPSLVCFLK